MAHIKVKRRSMRPQEWTDLRFCWLKRYIYSEKWEIQNLMIRDARQVADLVEARFPKLNGKVEIYDIGTTIGSHTGPGTVALFFWGSERVN